MRKNVHSFNILHEYASQPCQREKMYILFKNMIVYCTGKLEFYIEFY